MTVQSVIPLYLDIFLEPLADILCGGDVTDIYINRPGELWVERVGGSTERITRPELTESLMWRLARQIASVSHQGVSREHPLLAARLPDGTRVQVIVPPATRESVAIALRKHVAANLTLDHYRASGAFNDVQPDDHETPAEAQLRCLYDSGDWSRFIGAAVAARKTILISGGTSSGKTTFLNALLGEIPSDERLLFIEDTPEIAIRHANAVGTVAMRGELGEASVTAEDLLVAALRMRPDRIILGEVRGREAFTFLRAANSGHPGSLTTIHADSPSGALEQLALLAASTGMVRREDMLIYAARVIDVIVQLERRAGIRSVSRVRWNRQATVVTDEAYKTPPT